MLILILSLLVLNVTLLLMFGWILYCIWGRMEQTTEAILSIQRVLNAFDHPETLAQSGVEVGQSWVPSDQEQARLLDQFRRESHQRAGSTTFKRASRSRTGSPMVSSP